ncbi:MAG: NAD(P)-dependent alcohol dehydrogenase [Cyanophyceae cyanobacterium]
MKAVTINQYGLSDVLQYRDVDQPALAPNRLLVRVYASSVNPVDWKIRKGDLQLLSGYDFPLILGCDFAGVVEAVGAEVTLFQPGDEVYGMVNPLDGGAYAEYVAAPESGTAPKPGNMSFEEAAAVPVAALTALQSLLDLGQMRPGQQVLINGASGGVGTFAVQIAKAMFAQVTAVCSSKNFDLVQSLGAEAVIDYSQQDFTQLLKEYDIIFDAVGKRTFFECEQALTPQGIYISTLPTPLNLAPSLISSLLPCKKAKLVLAQPSYRDLKALRQLVESGKVHSVIDRVYPLSEIVKAHDYSEKSHAVGKIVLTHR